MQSHARLILQNPDSTMLESGNGNAPLTILVVLLFVHDASDLALAFVLRRGDGFAFGGANRRGVVGGVWFGGGGCDACLVLLWEIASTGTRSRRCDVLVAEL